jgi:hypothetical protein
LRFHELLSENWADMKLYLGLCHHTQKQVYFRSPGRSVIDVTASLKGRQLAPDPVIWSINAFGAVTGSYGGTNGLTLGFVRVPRHGDKH